MHQSDRRAFLKKSLIGLAALPFGAGVLSTRALAADMPMLTEDNPQAKALQYAADASAAGAPSGQVCTNCMHYTAENQGCALFPGYAVHKNGWCSAWAAAS
jgi:anaerobic selenocysteine-containing dehydrogenase